MSSGYSGEGSAAANWLGAQFAGRLVKKEYICLCEGPAFGPVGHRAVLTYPLRVLQLSKDTYQVEVASAGRPAETALQVMACFEMKGIDEVRGASSSICSLLTLWPKTGRKHQIRAHLAHAGRPIVGDWTYGRRE
ncbi:rluC, partial [Symbiodinium necroappetens]